MWLEQKKRRICVTSWPSFLFIMFLKNINSFIFYLLLLRSGECVWLKDMVTPQHKSPSLFLKTWYNSGWRQCGCSYTLILQKYTLAEATGSLVPRGYFRNPIRISQRGKYQTYPTCFGKIETRDPRSCIIILIIVRRSSSVLLPGQRETSWRF